MCRVNDYLHLFLLLRTIKFWPTKNLSTLYFHRIISAREKKNNSSWTGSVNPLKYYTPIWSDLCGTSDEWEHISIVWSMMHVCHVLWQKINGTIKCNRCSHRRPIFLLNVLRNTTEQNISRILIFTKKLNTWEKDIQKNLFPLNFLVCDIFRCRFPHFTSFVFFSGWSKKDY